MRIICHPGRLTGQISAIASKSDVHRLLICAALCDRPTRIFMPGWQGEDILATMRVLSALGASFAPDLSGVLVSPIKSPPPLPELDCGESGSTLRFMLPVVAALGCGGRFLGRGRLPSRPIAPLAQALELNGVRFDSPTLPFTMRGQLLPGRFALPGNLSSQFVTGLLLALPLLEKGGQIALEHRLESAGYVDMTLEALARFSVRVLRDERGFCVPKGQAYVSPGSVLAEGDWSNAAFFLAAGALGGDVRCLGLCPRSAQADAAMMVQLEHFGAAANFDAQGVFAAGRGPLSPVEVDLGPIPDLLPVLAVLAAAAPGVSRFYNGARLRLKESDRLMSTANLLRALGAEAHIKDDALIVRGGRALFGGTVDCHGDHRIAMAGAIAALICKEPTVLEGAQAVNKSYPSFFSGYQALGGKCDVIDHG